jgi:hypothetical protein
MTTIQRLIKKYVLDTIHPLHVISGGIKPRRTHEILHKNCVEILPEFIQKIDNEKKESQEWNELQKEHGYSRLMFRAIPNESIQEVIDSHKVGTFHLSSTYPLLWSKTGEYKEHFPYFNEYFNPENVEESKYKCIRSLGIYEVIIPKKQEYSSVITRGSIVLNSIESIVSNPKYVLPRWWIPNIHMEVYKFSIRNYYIMTDNDLFKSFQSPYIDETKYHSKGEIEDIIQHYH